MRVFIPLFATVLLIACTQQPTKPDVSAQSAFESYVEALNAGETDTAANYYDTADGFHWIERGGIQYENGSDAANSLRDLQSTASSKMTLDNIRVAELSATSALISTHFDFTMLSAANEPQFSFDGWMTVGMVYREGGWKIAGGQTGPGNSE